MSVESIGWEFDVLQANSLDEHYPRLEAVFVGIAPAIAYDAQNQPKFNRTIERHLKALERQIRQTHQTELSHLGSPDLAQNATIIQNLVRDYHQQLTQTILIPQQLELESLTLAGEWPLFWTQTAPLVQRKDREREPMPFSNPTATPNAPTDEHAAAPKGQQHPASPQSYKPV